MEWVKPLCSEKLSEHFVRMYQTLNGPQNWTCGLGYAGGHEPAAEYLLLWADAESLMPLCKACTEYALRTLTLTANAQSNTISSLSQLACPSTGAVLGTGMVHVHAELLRFTPPVSMLWRS